MKKQRFTSPILRNLICAPNQPKQSARLNKIELKHSICTADPDTAISVSEFERKNKGAKL